MNDIQNEQATAVNDNETQAAPTRVLKQPKLPNECKCIVLQGFGSVKQLKSISIPLPTPGDNEVLVNVKAW
jgi:hypothetical protein